MQVKVPQQEWERLRQPRGKTQPSWLNLLRVGAEIEQLAKLGGISSVSMTDSGGVVAQIGSFRVTVLGEMAEVNGETLQVAELAGLIRLLLHIRRTREMPALDDMLNWKQP